MRVRLCLDGSVKSWLLSLLAALFSLATVACDGDGAVDGARSRCAEGGALGDCASEVTTSEEACDRLVTCAAIPRQAEQDNGFDWGLCVDRMQRFTPAQESFAISCIAASSCDDLKVNGSPNQPNQTPFCLEYGDR